MRYGVPKIQAAACFKHASCSFLGSNGGLHPGSVLVPAAGEPMRKKILIVEDNEDVALGLTVRFAGAGFEVRSVTNATDGVKAIDLFEPELVLLDLLVPGGGGFAVLNAMRRATPTSNVPVIVMYCLGVK